MKWLRLNEVRVLILEMEWGVTGGTEDVVFEVRCKWFDRPQTTVTGEGKASTRNFKLLQ